MDINGRTIKTIEKGTQNAGNYLLELNAGDMNEGIYFMQMKSGDKVSTRKFIVR
jgi:hypothetical protein